MFQRRTRALVELGGSVLTLLLLVRFWKDLQDREGPISMSPFGVTVGALSQGIRLWLRDRDVAGIRTNSGRRVLYHFVWSGWRAVVRRSSSDSTTARYDFGVGALAATIAYRLWYGLLRPLPGSAD